MNSISKTLLFLHILHWPGRLWATAMLWPSRPPQDNLLLIPMASLLHHYELEWLYFSITLPLITGDWSSCISWYRQSLQIFVVNFSGFRFIYMYMTYTWQWQVCNTESRRQDKLKTKPALIGEGKEEGEGARARVIRRNCISFMYSPWKENTVN